MADVELRDYQKNAISQIEGAIAFGSEEVCLSAPTSFGKTITISQFIKDQVDMGKSVVFMMNLSALVSQTRTTLKAMGIPYRIVAAEYDGLEFDHQAKVTIAMQQTLYSRIDKVNIDCDVLVIDEFHRSFRTDTMEAVKKKLKPDIIVGVSATPYDEKGLALPNVDIVETTTIKELTDQKFLTPLRTFSVQFSEDIDYSEAGSGEYSENFLNGIINNDDYNSNVVKAWQKIASDRKTIVFCTGIDHAEALSAQFAQNGVKAKAYHSKIPVMDSRAIMKDFRNNEIQVLCSVNKILVGFDDPSITCGIACRPTKTRRVWQQACGRMIRLFENKKDAILLDCAQWTAEHGFYDEPYSAPALEEKGELKRIKEQASVPIMKLVVAETPLEINRKTCIKKIEELNAKRKQIPDLNVKDLLAIYETSQEPLEILRVAYEMNRRKTGQTYTRKSVEWVAEKWYELIDKVPQFKTRLLKTLRTMAKRKVSTGKKLTALHYSPEWLLEQSPYKDYNVPDYVEPPTFEGIDEDEVPF
jgi:superfamily II DNA or RNA helicase